MVRFGRIYLDTNIFIAAFENKNELSSQLSDLFVVDGAQAHFATSELTLSELLVKPYKSGDDTAIDLYEGMIKPSEWLEMIPVGRQVLSYAAVLRSQYPSLKLPDAIHVSSALAAGCSHILTGDTGFKNAYEFVHTRYGISKRSNALIVIRPETATIRTLWESLAE